MPFNFCKKEGSLVWCRALAAICWLLLISGLHYWLNIRSDNRREVLLGYMPVISNIAAPLLDYASRSGSGVRFKALKFASFAEMAEALRNDQIEAAFIIAPLAIVLRQQDVDIKVVYIGNRHESTMVADKNLQVKSLDDLVGRTVAIPMRYSGHNIALLEQLEAKGLAGRVKIVEMFPPDMAAALATGRLDAYFVGEPFAATTLKTGDASVVFYAEDVWENFICNLVIIKQTMIENDPAVVETLVRGAARSGIWANEHIGDAAAVASKYWNQPVDVIKYAMDTPKSRIVFDRYIPREEELQKLADLMVQYKLSESKDVSGLIDDRFAKAVGFGNITDINSIFTKDSQ
ncbi:MAG: ABC transporter substrate-binding protein [Thermodesulfobacteriota bacterium]